MLAKVIGLIGLGIAIFVLSYQYNKRFLDWLRFQSIGTRDYIVERLGIMFIEIPPQRILLGLFVLSFGLGSLVFLAFLPKLTPGFLRRLSLTALPANASAGLGALGRFTLGLGSQVCSQAKHHGEN